MSNILFLLDENIPKLVKRFLESEGYSVEYVPKGIKNSKLASLSLEKESVLVTRDNDFLDTILFPPKEFFGIIVFRIHPPRKEKLLKSLSLLLREVKEFKGKTFIVEEDEFEVVEI